MKIQFKKFYPKVGLSALPFLKNPYILLFTITERCNLRCSYCFGKYYSEKGELSYRQIKKIFSQFYDLGVRRLGISGGEPLLHKDIDKVIKMAVDLGFEVGLNSNGILVPYHLKALRLLNNLSISLDGTSEKVHDKYRGKGAFKKAIAGIEAATKVGIPVHLCCTLTDANLNEWPKILDLAKKYRALVQINPLYPRIRGDGGLKLARVWEEKIKKMLLDIIQKKKNGSPIFYSENTYRLMSNWPDYKNDISPQKEKGHSTCLAGKKLLALDSRGNLFPCTRLTGEVLGRNCLKMGVKNAYKSLPMPSCKSCRWACFIEYNSLLNLKLSVVLNLLFNRFSKL